MEVIFFHHVYCTFPLWLLDLLFSRWILAVFLFLEMNGPLHLRFGDIFLSKWRLFWSVFQFAAYLKYCIRDHRHVSSWLPTLPGESNCDPITGPRRPCDVASSLLSCIWLQRGGQVSWSPARRFMFNVSPFTKVSVRTIRCGLRYQEHWQLIPNPSLPGHMGFGTGMSFGSICGAGG